MSVSVVVPVYNGASVLERTVPAVLALDEVDEWVWVDDGSTDGSPSLLARLTEGRPGVTVCRLASNEGRAAARNAGLALARGDVVAFLDADARPRSGYVRAHLDALSAPGAVASMGRIWAADPVHGDPYAVYLDAYPRGPQREAGPIEWRFLVTCAACLRADVLRSVGGFDPAVGYGEDSALACQLASRHPDGLHVARADVDLFGTESLAGALDKARQFGGSLPRIESVCPDALGRLGLSGLDSAAVRALARNPALGRAVSAALPRLPRRWVAPAVRYLLANALARGYSDARDGLPSNPSRSARRARVRRGAGPG